MAKVTPPGFGCKAPFSSGLPPAGRGCRAPPHPGSPGAGPSPSFQAFVRSRPTAELAGQGVRGFLSDLAVRQGVAASTQNQAFNALLFSMIYLQTVPSVTLKEAKSPLDCL